MTDWAAVHGTTTGGGALGEGLAEDRLGTPVPEAVRPVPAVPPQG